MNGLIAKYQHNLQLKLQKPFRRAMGIMGYLLWVKTQIYLPPMSLSWFEQYRVISDPVYTGLECTLQRRHNECDGVSNHQPHHCLLNRLFRRGSKKASKLRVSGLCAGNSPGTGEFPAQMASNAEDVSIWSLHHDTPPNKWTLVLLNCALSATKLYMRQ